MSIAKRFSDKPFGAVHLKTTFSDNEHLNIMNMNLHEQLILLQETYSDMRKYYMECAAIGSGLIYTSDDFNREGYILDKTRTTKDEINKQ